MKKTHDSTSLKNFIDLGGTLADKDIAIEKAKKYTNDSEVLKIVSLYYTLLADTNYLDNLSYEFYINRLSYNQIMEKYDKNKNSVRNMIYNDRVRLYKELGGYDIYAMLVENKFNSLNLKIIERILNKLLFTENDLEFRKKNVKVGLGEDEEKVVFLGDKLTVQPKNFEIDLSFNSRISNKTFKDLISLIEPLVKAENQKFINKINPKVLGYLQHLYESGEHNLSSTELAHKKYLLHLLGD